MGSKYRLELVKIGDEQDETLLAIEGTRVVVTRALELADFVLGAEASEEHGEDRPSPQAEVGNYGAGQPADRPLEMTPAEPVKRKRRTKAEMAAARAGGEAEVPGEVAEDDVPETPAAALEPKAMTPGESVPLAQPVTYVGEPGPGINTATTLPPAVYNPFA